MAKGPLAPVSLTHVISLICLSKPILGRKGTFLKPGFPVVLKPVMELALADEAGLDS